MKRTLLLLVALFGFGVAASPAEATWFHYHRSYYYAPAPVYYAPTAYYAPAPVYTRPVYYAPRVSYYAHPTVVYRPVTTYYYRPAPRISFYYGW